MFNEIKKSIELGGNELWIKTGKVARQSSGSVLVGMGDTVILSTVCIDDQSKEDINFLPLSVHYREMFSAAGKIPGGFIKRESKPSDQEVLVSRLIDRPIRPLIDKNLRRETQVICTLLSYDPKHCSDVLALIAASAALSISQVPFEHTLAASKVGYVDGEFVLNPSKDALKNSKLDLMVAGTDTSVMMIESEASELSETQMLDAIKFGHESMRPVIAMIEELKSEIGKAKVDVSPIYDQKLEKQIAKDFQDKILACFDIKVKQERNKAFGELIDTIIKQFSEQGFAEHVIRNSVKTIESDLLRDKVLTSGVRLDNRSGAEIRQISCDTSWLPRAHGSALFTRGETQSMVTVTLGSSSDEQIVDGLDQESKERFMLNYTFPPYSVGETSPMRAPSRRETGHGKLAWRALNALVPTREKFPYAIRVVSEISESNGSSSMATVCGASLALMDAGVPIKSAVAGIAMGLIKSEDTFVVLSDITGDEDSLGDMDFKVTGTKDGITALQMDIKVSGITLEIMQQAITQGKEGIDHILTRMNEVIEEPKTELSVYAPLVKQIKINKDKIRDLIGPGGKVIKELCETTGAKIDVNDDGTVSIAISGKKELENAVARVLDITSEVELGSMITGIVVKVLDSGAFVKYTGGNEGFIHISEIMEGHVESIHDHLKENAEVTAKVLGVDRKGKARLSLRKDAKVRPERDFGSDRPRGGGRRDSGPSRSGGGGRRDFGSSDRSGGGGRRDFGSSDRPGGGGGSRFNSDRPDRSRSGGGRRDFGDKRGAPRGNRPESSEKKYFS